jgi:tetratricopeptide (TPR) repeat protein
VQTECNNEDGSPDQAIIACSQVIKVDSRAAWAYFKRGNAYQAKGELDRAIADYGKALELGPKNDVAWSLLGMARYDAGDFKGASADLLQSMEIDEDAYATLYRFLARSRAGEAAEAELEVNTAG